jgi:hypothetical protein
MYFVRVPPPASSPTTASEIMPVPTSAKPWRKRAPMNWRLLSTSPNAT